MLPTLPAQDYPGELAVWLVNAVQRGVESASAHEVRLPGNQLQPLVEPQPSQT
jgi:hypothetical protein